MYLWFIRRVLNVTSQTPVFNVIHLLIFVLVEAERCAVRGYTNICNITAGKDHRTYDLAQSILNEEVEHESWFSELCGKDYAVLSKKGI